MGKVLIVVGLIDIGLMVYCIANGKGYSSSLNIFALPGGIELGRPMQNGFIECFNGSFRRGVLDIHVFRNLSEVREHAELWLADYNPELPHDGLGGLTPAEFRMKNDPATSNLAWH